MNHPLIRSGLVLGTKTPATIKGQQHTVMHRPMTLIQGFLVKRRRSYKCRPIKHSSEYSGLPIFPELGMWEEEMELSKRTDYPAELASSGWKAVEEDTLLLHSCTHT